MKKEYLIKEVIAYYILGYKQYKKENEKNDFVQILKNILELVQKNASTIEIRIENAELFNKICFSWILSVDDILAYATCIFYFLTNREKEITEEKIVKEFLNQIHLHHPRRVIKEANIILDNVVSKYHNE